MDKTTLAAEILSTCYTSGKYQKTKNKRNPWAFHELMFETAKNWYHKKQYLSILSDITKNFGMSTEEFDKCIEDVNIKKFVLDANLEHMRKQNINSTPTFIIKYPDGKLERIEGFKHYAFFEKKFNDALKVA